MFSLFKKIWKQRKFLRSILYSIYFNFHYLPFSQAWKLPILFYKPRFLKMKGKVKIEADKVTFGMIQLGFLNVSLYPNSGIIYENHGGEVIFKGKSGIGNNSAISIGNMGRILFGEHFFATTTLRLTSYSSIEFKPYVLCGWECTFMDTDFHRVTKIDGTAVKGFAPILIGAYNWFGLKTTVMKGTETPDCCVIGANSLLNRKYDVDCYSLIAGNPAEKKASGVWRNYRDDEIDYTSFLDEKNKSNEF